MAASPAACFHLPGLFEHFAFYRVFLPLWREHRDWFFDFCAIGSIYGAPASCIWGGGRVGTGEGDAREIFRTLRGYGIPARLTFSNSLLREEHLGDRRCNALCALLAEEGAPGSGVIVHSDLLLHHLRQRYPSLAFTSSTTKVLTEFGDLRTELEREEFSSVVPDFRLNHEPDRLEALPQALKNKVEFLVNECCFFGCRERKACYENVSRRNLGEDCPDHVCTAPGGNRGYRFSAAMRNPAFISSGEIRDRYLPAGFTNFKIEGRGLGSALLLEFLLYYMTKPEHRLEVREEIYLDPMLDLF